MAREKSLAFMPLTFYLKITTYSFTVIKRLTYIVFQGENVDKKPLNYKGFKRTILGLESPGEAINSYGALQTWLKNNVMTNYELIIRNASNQNVMYIKENCLIYPRPEGATGDNRWDPATCKFTDISVMAGDAPLVTKMPGVGSVN